VNESYLRLLEDKVRNYEGVPTTRHRAVHIGKGKRRVGAPQDDSEVLSDEEGIEGEHPLQEPFNQLTVDQTSTSGYIPETRDVTLGGQWLTGSQASRDQGRAIIS
jgi:hypothetical protein